MAIYLGPTLITNLKLGGTTPTAVNIGGTKVYPEAAPTVTIAPTSGAGYAGAVVAFTATAAGRNVTYQWLNNAAPISGQTAATYNHTIAGAGSITCTVTDAYGQAATSTAAAITQWAAPTCTIAMTPASVLEGAVLNFTATPGGGSGTYTYQWLAGGVAIGGATAATYARTTVLADNGVVITCTVTSSGASVTSAGQTMVVTAAASPSAFDAKVRSFAPIVYFKMNEAALPFYNQASGDGATGTPTAGLDTFNVSQPPQFRSASMFGFAANDFPKFHYNSSYGVYVIEQSSTTIRDLYKTGVFSVQWIGGLSSTQTGITDFGMVELGGSQYYINSNLTMGIKTQQFGAPDQFSLTWGNTYIWGGAPAKDTPYLFIMTADGTNTRLYINGVLTLTHTMPSDIANAADPGKLGQGSSISEPDFGGGRFAMWPTTLSQAQITELWNALPK